MKQVLLWKNSEVVKMRDKIIIIGASGHGKVVADIARLNMEYADQVLKGEMEVTEVNDFVEAPEINADNVDEYIQLYIENGEISESGTLEE